MLLPIGVLIGAPRAVGASGPRSWPCNAKALGLDRVVLQLAPVEKSERFSRGGRVTSKPDGRGKWVPVILVHGWTGSATHPESGGRRGAFSGPVTLSPNVFNDGRGSVSLVGMLQNLPGAAVFTYDYHTYSGRWVTDPHLGPGLARAVDCLAEASGEKVIVVGHSMGGLVARYAAAAPGPDGAADRRAQISRIVTLGTPNAGSLIAMLAGNLIDDVPLAAALRVILSACGSMTTQDLDNAGVCSIWPMVGAFAGDAGRALRAGSRELSDLPKVPRSVPVTAFAGQTVFTTKKMGWFAMPWDTIDIAAGDLVVTRESALDSADEDRDVACRYQLSIERRVADEVGVLLGVTAKNDVAKRPLDAASGPCFHTFLMRALELANDVTGVVADDIADRYVSREDLLSAPVPALRGNPAGVLVNGEHAKGPDGYSNVSLVTEGGAAPALGDLNGDGRGDAVAVIAATSGAGGGDHYLCAYTKRDGKLVRLADFDLVTISPDAMHAFVTGMIIRDGEIAVTWDTSTYGAAAGKSYAANLRLRGGRLVAGDVRLIERALTPADIDFDLGGDIGERGADRTSKHTGAWLERILGPARTEILPCHADTKNKAYHWGALTVLTTVEERVGQDVTIPRDAVIGWIVTGGDGPRLTLFPGTGIDWESRPADIRSAYGSSATDVYDEGRLRIDVFMGDFSNASFTFEGETLVRIDSGSTCTA